MATSTAHPHRAVHDDPIQGPTLFGHPAGLFVLFFAEMWERFSYYGMRALLLYYMIKGFLAMGDNQAYAVYGAYTSLVYATPFIGGMLADRLLGERKAVVLGGSLMATGHLLMTAQNRTAFFVALALLITGNGFFKPNISTIVGSLYPEGSSRRDSGFTLFYMGINLGATMSPLLCGYIGETYGWHYGFGLATLGMLTGLMVFVAPTIFTQILVGGGALITAATLVYLPDNPYLLAVNVFVSVALIIAGAVAVVALGRGALPPEAGEPPDREALKRPFLGFLRAEWAVYLGALLVVPVIALLVQHNTAVLWVLSLVGIAALVIILVDAFRSEKVARDRLFVVVILMFFSMLFWAFFEQAGSSVNNFTDRNVDRVMQHQVVTASDVGTTLDIAVTQEQLGYPLNGKVFTMDQLDDLREKKATEVQWPIEEGDVGMGLAEAGAEIPGSVFQAANPIYIVIFGLIFSWLWEFLGKRGLEPNTPVKFSLGLLQLGIGFGCYYMGASHPDARGMVWMGWLLLGYLFQTTGELCLSPVGLSMVTKLSPVRIVSTVMGAWFLATAFSNYLAGLLATLTGVVAEGGGEKTIPPPIDTVHVYGHLFGQIAVVAAGSAVLLFILSPLLHKWMHDEAVHHVDDDEVGPGEAVAK